MVVLSKPGLIITQWFSAFVTHLRQMKRRPLCVFVFVGKQAERDLDWKRMTTVWIAFSLVTVRITD